MAEYWLAMASASKDDGNVILVVYDDFSGVRPVYWSAGNDIDGPGWYDASDGQWVASSTDLAGWLPCPQHN